MRDMKKYTSLVLLTLLVMLAGSCSKDTPVESRAESANITVNIASRGQVDTGNTEVKADEGIKTLRLIMVQEGKVAGNWVREYNDNSLTQTFRILGVKSVDTQLYAIVNEKGVSLDYATAFQVGIPFNSNTYKGAALVDPNVTTNGIPMEGSTQITAAQMVEETSFSIPVTRALARIDLTVNNKTGGELRIDQINFGAFFPVAGYLMKGQGGTVLNQAKNFPENPTIAANATHTFTYYLFESSGGTYTVGMKGSTNYDLAQISDKVTQQPIASIERNQILKIDANANPTGWELTCSVAPWIVNDSKIEFTDALTYTSYGWKQGTIAGRQDNVVELAQNVTAELTFLIQGPTGVQRWVAEVDDSENFELLTKEGAELFKDGTPVVQTIQVRVKEGANKDAVTKLHVYAVVAGSYSELDLTDAEGTSGVTHFELKIAGGQ